MDFDLWDPLLNLDSISTLHSPVIQGDFTYYFTRYESQSLWEEVCKRSEVRIGVTWQGWKSGTHHSLDRPLTFLGPELSLSILVWPDDADPVFTASLWCCLWWSRATFMETRAKEETRIGCLSLKLSPNCNQARTTHCIQHQKLPEYSLFSSSIAFESVQKLKKFQWLLIKPKQR